jgi:hypothetical protein
LLVEAVAVLVLVAVVVALVDIAQVQGHQVVEHLPSLH